ncbi:hypothetical protein SAMN05428944_1967 [Streptomyces sp. 1222.5]|uniref:hypothetical protein n=1 Tax=unclassified Streptomyces TaxID=2593676 RepID=UPI00089C67F7|nr:MULTISPECIES: hypothetical protein [unclassified Streptomyces]PKW10831.1 hypothetical protein BX260_6125 [Streptomyces sp. 5112.2]SEB95407.1 hypothetical protein SAMN05428944_1967 [Streptomyces sp. 1222.5]
MPESVPVRCPACRRAHLYTAPAYPCACGAPTAPRLDPATEPAVSAHRAWDDEWLTVPCAVCGRRNQWPRPELGCPCGTVLRVPVTAAPETSAGPLTETAPGARGAPGQAPAGPDAGEAAAARRPAFQPRAIRTARDAVTAAALYLRWLGYRGIRRADQRPPNGIGLAARGLLAQVDPTVRPAALRDVECLWLTATTESADCVYFSLAVYTDEARTRATSLGVPLFVLDLAGDPQPMNDPAEALHGEGAPAPGGGARDRRT